MESQGLTTREAQRLLALHGYNEIRDEREPLWHKLLMQLRSPITAMLAAAAALSLWSGKYFDGWFILVLLVLNLGVTLWQEYKADTAIAALNAHLGSSVKVRRDGVWKMLAARMLVPGDVVELKLGDIVPADARVLSANNATLNEAALTGESLPKDKTSGDLLYAGSFIAAGLLTATVSATGSSTYFGKTLHKVDRSGKKSSLEQNILRISRFLSILSLCAVALLTLVLLLHGAPWLEIARLDLSLIIAGIPISLPTVMTLIIAFGTIALARKKVVVRRLSALEELADTDLLLTDKTGTLTKNHITVGELLPYGASAQELAALGALIAAHEPESPLKAALLSKSNAAVAEVRTFTPPDSTRKRSTTTIELDGALETLSLGAPQVVASLCKMSKDAHERFAHDVDALAARGYRTLALSRARGQREEKMELLGLFALSDELREDAGDVIEFLTRNGIEVVMLTGDNRAIAKEIAQKLHIPGQQVVPREELPHDLGTMGRALFTEAQAFAEILPEDKLALVKAAKRSYTVAVNGDGVNDLPAVKEANVGFAVKNAVDALRGAADIVLLTDGIAVMRDAFIEGRTIFARLYSYSLYRISESFRLIITIALLGLLTGTYPLSPLQLIVLALLNDVPIISLAFDRVKLAQKPSHLNVREQFTKSLLFGSVGVLNSMLLFALAVYTLHLPWAVVQTLFFLKLTVSGHLLIYVAHTAERWWRYLPSRPIILATTLTQALATLCALTGFLMPAAISWQLAVFVWLWALLFMQLGEGVKMLAARDAASAAASLLPNQG